MVLLSTFVALSFTISGVLSRTQVCGKALADMLDFVCSDRGFHWVQRDGRLPTIEKRTAVQYLTKRSSSYNSPSSSGGGVVEECCRKPCSIYQMERYCAASEGTYFPFPTGAPMLPETAKELTRTNPPVTFSRSKPVRPTAPVTTAQPVTPPALGPIPARFGKKPPLFFFVRGMLRNRPTRTPVTRLDVQH